MAITRSEKKKYARQLYIEGLKQVQIARVLGVSPNTVWRWANDDEDNWQDARIKRNMMDQTSEEAVRELIEYQLMVLKNMKEEMIEKGELKLIPRGDIDGLQKLYTTIKRSEMKWTDLVKIIREFMDYVKGEDIDLAKRLVDLSNEFLNEKRKLMS